ncbi:MAG TPA: GNAT family N-acetyltransferase [Anaeromyxobacter sp.]
MSQVEAVASREFPVVIRHAEPSDVAVVSETWLESYRNDSPWAHRLTDRVFFAHHQPAVAELLSRSCALVACDPQDERVVYGAVVWEPLTPEGPALHWVYVRKALRRFGIARRLLAATDLPPDLAGVNVTHPTYSWYATRRLGPGGEVVRAGRSGLEELFPRAVVNFYLGLGVPSRDALEVP